MMKRWSKGIILDEIRDWVFRYGEPPTVLEWGLDPAKPDQAVVRYWFGTWKAAMIEAGVKPRGRGAPYHLLPQERLDDGRFVSYDDSE